MLTTNQSVIYLSCAGARNLITHSKAINDKDQSSNETHVIPWLETKQFRQMVPYFGSCMTLMLQAPILDSSYAETAIEPLKTRACMHITQCKPPLLGSPSQRKQHWKEK